MVYSLEVKETVFNYRTGTILNGWMLAKTHSIHLLKQPVLTGLDKLSKNRLIALNTLRNIYSTHFQIWITTITTSKAYPLRSIVNQSLTLSTRECTTRIQRLGTVSKLESLLSKIYSKISLSRTSWTSIRHLRRFWKSSSRTLRTQFFRRQRKS